jgi:hypothetical protein
LISLLSNASQLVWLDGAGYWSADPATGAVRFLAERSQPAIALPDPPTYPAATRARAIEWSPGGQSALYVREVVPSGQLELTYVPADGSPLAELGMTLGQQVEQLTWLLPTAR